MRILSGNTITPSGDIQTPYDYKIASLGQKLIDGTTPKDVVTIPLDDQGGGFYGATFTGTSIPGTDVFEAVLDGTSRSPATWSARSGRDAGGRRLRRRRARVGPAVGLRSRGADLWSALRLQRHFAM